jgi:phage N-6-adenine-methyltransferase
VALGLELHQKPRSEASLSDEYETPIELCYRLWDQYNWNPRLDVAANDNNHKCVHWLDDALEQDWLDFDDCTDIEIKSDIWCNPPHSLNESFVRKAYLEWIRNDLNIMMIIPTNTMSSKYWHECIEGMAEYHPIKGRIRFLVDGKPSKYASRNAYCVVIWRKLNK